MLATRAVNAKRMSWKGSYGKRQQHSDGDVWMRWVDDGQATRE